jgi:Apea-like HEPN
VTDTVSILAEVAASIWRERSTNPYEAPEWLALSGTDDAAIGELNRQSYLQDDRHPMLVRAYEAVLADADMELLRPDADTGDVAVNLPMMAMRTKPQTVVRALFSVALQRRFLLRLPEDDATYVALVLEGLQELRRAARGERVRGHNVLGLAGITLPDGAQFSTPWGDVRPIPSSAEISYSLRAQQTTCTLISERLLPVQIGRDLDLMPTGPDESDRARMLLPLACAFSGNAGPPVAPVVTWSTTIAPFSIGTGVQFPHQTHPPIVGVDVGDRIRDIEDWARTIDREHVGGIDVASKRLVSAIAHRLDRSDALIDAVMVWENLVGTSIETSFRVTAAITKLIEPDPGHRKELYGELKGIYSLRSRVVHGDSVEDAAVAAASTRAIEIAVLCLRASYARGNAWLNMRSTERADRLLLIET